MIMIAILVMTIIALDNLQAVVTEVIFKEIKKTGKREGRNTLNLLKNT